MQADSNAVLKVCFFTLTNSHTPISLISAISPVFPFNPLYHSPSACLALNSVIDLMTSHPQFYAKVLGMLSNAAATALNGYCFTPSRVLAY